MNFVSLFSGMGGFDLGFERAGMRCVLQAEQNPDCLHVLAHHWPDVPKKKDVRRVTKRSCLSADVICGGFPCQDLSVAGKRAGLGGERSGLWWEFARIIERVRPLWVSIENVPGLFSSTGGRDFALILSRLVQLGYGVAWRVLNSQYFGVPQRRRRVFIVGCLGSRTRAAKVLFESESCAGDSPPSRQAGSETAFALAASVGRTREGSRVGNAWNTNYVAGTIGSGSSSTRLNFDGDYVVNALDTRQGGADDNDAQAGHLVAFQCHGSNVGPMGAIRAGNGNEAGGVPFIAHSFRAEGHDASEDGAGRGTPLVCFQQNQRDELRTMEVAGALAAEPGMKQQNYLAGAGVRRLTPTECLRLQAFPDDWLDLTPPLSDSAKYKMCGNAVTVSVIEWIGRRIMEASR